MSTYTLPEDPLERFIRSFQAVYADKRWTEDVSALRYAALTLATVEGDPGRLADELRSVADILKDRAGWFGPLNSSIRFGVAAMLMRHRDDPAAFCDEVERVEDMFREAGLRARSAFSVLAILILREQADDRRIRPDRIRRFCDIYREMKKHHRWLTGPDDYPACALLCQAEDAPSRIGERVEAFYEGLRDRDFQRGNGLQTVSHILFFNPASDQVALTRFRAIYDGFKEAGLWMNTGDYDEVAILSFLDHPVATVVRRTLEHRVKIAEMRPRPGKELSYSLACSTTFLELVQLNPELNRIHDVQNVMQIQAILQAQQAAMIAAAAGASAAAASSSSSS